MYVKIIVAVLLVFMIYNLFKALYIMIKADPNKPSMSKFLGRRVLFSAIIIIFLIIAMGLGWIVPNPSPI